MHGNLSSCAESVFIAARRPRGVARERENGEERVASNPERQLNPCTRPRPFLHNTYVQPLTNVTNTGGKRCKTRLRNGGLRGRSIVFAAMPRKIFSERSMRHFPRPKRTGRSHRIGTKRGGRSIDVSRNRIWNVSFFCSRRFPSRRGVRGLEITVTVPWFRVDSMTRSEKAGLLPTFPTDTF